jgi:hypothetical protein
MRACQCCGSTEFTLLGVLGFLKWLRCRACGMEFSRAIRRGRRVTRPAERATTNLKGALS